ncbi:MAG: FHA domain-containing protein [Atopobiaceae bacterium]|nr:FHA domain-containing protein [Atopobiaceae bacterium]
MARKGSPSSVMYAQLKEFGISNRDAARLLLNTSLTFDGRMLGSRIDDSSQLSRRIVHTAPEELPQSLFNNFAEACTVIERRILQRLAASALSSDMDRARRELQTILEVECVPQMTLALRSFGMDSSLYNDVVIYIQNLRLAREEDRTFLHLLLFVVTGCVGNPRISSRIVTDYATDVLGAEYHTAPTQFGMGQKTALPSATRIGLVRVTGGFVPAGSRMHVLNPDGTCIGLLPSGDHIIADVDADVSRNHAYIWQDGEHWYLRDLGSTNGTRLVSGGDGSERAVGRSVEEAPELFASDIICLGATTRFMVMPVFGT